MDTNELMVVEEHDKKKKEKKFKQHKRIIIVLVMVILLLFIFFLLQRKETEVYIREYEKHVEKIWETHLLDDMKETAENVIGIIMTHMPFVPSVMFSPAVKKVLDSKKVTDHHALLPTA